MNKPWYKIARQIARDKGLTYADMASVLGVSDAAVGHYFVGRRKAPLETIRKIAAMLEVPLMTLVEEDLDVCRTNEETRLLELFRSIPADQHALALKLLEQMTSED